MSTHQDPHDERFECLEAIDVLLGQDTPAERAKAREERARDPLAAVEFAETRQLLEAMRGLRVEPSDRLRRGLDSVVRECARRQSRRRPTPALWLQVSTVAAAAAVLFSLLWVFDPLALREPQIKDGELAVAAAKAQLKRARIDLSRTKVQLPFSGRVRST